MINLVCEIYRNINGYNYKSLSEFRTATNLKMIKNYLAIKQTKEKWLEYQQSGILNKSKIKELMRNMLVYKSINKEPEYLAIKQELEKLDLNFEQTNEIEKFVDQIMERNK